MAMLIPDTITPSARSRRAAGSKKTSAPTKAAGKQGAGGGGLRAQQAKLRPAGGAPRSDLLTAFGVGWMAGALPGSNTALSVNASVQYGILQTGVTFGGSLSRDDDRQYRLSGTLTVTGGLHAPGGGIGAYLDFGLSLSRTWAFKDYAGFARWVQLQEAKIQQALASYGLSKGSKLTPAQRAALRARVKADGHVTATGVKLAATAGIKAGGGAVSGFDASVQGSAKQTLYERRAAKGPHKGKLQRKRGVEKRLDLSFEKAPLKVTGFYQNMRGHANPDMDGEYVNVSLARTASAKYKAKHVSLAKAKGELGGLKDSVKSLGQTTTKNAAELPQRIYTLAAKRQLGVYGAELEWVVKSKGTFLRFARLFSTMDTSVGGGIKGPGAGVSGGVKSSSRRVIAEGLGTATLNYVTQLHNGFARRGKPGMQQWRGWVAGHAGALHGMYVSVGTPGSPAYNEAKADLGGGAVKPFVAAVKAGKVGKGLTAGQLQAIANLIVHLSAKYRTAGDKQWKNVGGMHLTVNQLGPTATFAATGTVSSSSMSASSLSSLFSHQAADVTLKLARSGRTFVDRGGADYKRIATELGMLRSATIDVRDTINGLGGDGAKWVPGGFPAWQRYVSATGPKQQEQRNAAALEWVRHMVSTVRVAPLSGVNTNLVKPPAG